MTVPMFLRPPTTKTAAGGVSLGADVKAWPAEILKEAFRQVPYLSGYDVDVTVDRSDEDKGYALGALIVRNKEETPVFADVQGKPLEDIVNKSLRIPVVVKEGQMRPLRVLSDDAGFAPLSEFRLGSGLFRTDVASMLGTGPGDQSLVDQLYPPTTSRFAGGGSSITTKTAADLLDQAAATMAEADREEFLNEIRGDALLAHAVRRNEALASAVGRVMEADPLTVKEASDAITDNLRPDVAQVVRTRDSYLVKTATREAYVPVSTHMSRAEVVATFGEEVASRVDDSGMITAGRTFAAQPAEHEKLATVTRYGRYRVKVASGHWTEGWVFPQVVDLDMRLTGQSLYTDGLNGALEEKVAGIPAEGAMFPAGHGLSGRGFFMAVSGDQAVATVPVTIHNAVREAGDGYYNASTDLGQQVKLSQIHGIKRVVKVADGHYGVPAVMEFVRIRGRAKLVDDTAEDSARKLASRVVIRSDRSCYSLDGGPLDKLGSCEFLERADAEFLLVAMGAHPTRARAKLAEADLSGKAEILSMWEIVPRDEATRRMMGGVLEKTAAIRSALPKVRLIKEAAAVEDQETVDAILSLNFLTPANVSLFLENIPVFEKAAGHLAELCLASQLGLQNLDEDAVTRAMTGIDSVIRGLRTLEHDKV